MTVWSQKFFKDKSLDFLVIILLWLSGFIYKPTINIRLFNTLENSITGYKVLGKKCWEYSVFSQFFPKVGFGLRWKASRGGEIRTPDLMLPKHLTTLVGHYVYKPLLNSCGGFLSLTWKTRIYLTAIWRQSIFSEWFYVLFIRSTLNHRSVILI